MSEKEEELILTMCWFGFKDPFATSVVHVPEHIISPREIDEGELLFIWDDLMKSDVLQNLLNTPVPWSPALIKGFFRIWEEQKDGSLIPQLIKKKKGNCMGAVLLTKRLEPKHIEILTNHYDQKGYSIQTIEALIGDHKRKVQAVLPK